jgi:hypothetical protein
VPPGIDVWGEINGNDSFRAKSSQYGGVVQVPGTLESVHDIISLGMGVAVKGISFLLGYVGRIRFPLVSAAEFATC